MKGENHFSRLLAFLHLIFSLGLFFTPVMLLSVGLLFFPAFSAVFALGKDLLFGRYNVYDKLMKRLICEMKGSIKMLRFLPVELLFMLQLLGIYFGGIQGWKVFQVMLVPIAAFLLVFQCYLCGYAVFINKKCSWFEVFLAMFYRIQYFISLWILAVLGIVVVSIKNFMVLLLAAGGVALIVEVIIFLSLISYEKACKGTDINIEKPEWYLKLCKETGEKGQE